MERDFGQLIFVALLILAGLFDLVVRWRKARGRRDAPPEDDGELPFVEEDDTDLEEPEQIEPAPRIGSRLWKFWVVISVMLRTPNCG